MQTAKTMLVLCLSLTTMPVFAKGDLTRQEPIEVNIMLGDADNPMAFTPSNLKFETGKLYKLVFRNESDLKHYFVSEKFSNAVFSRKVQVMGADGKRISEVKGIIKEIEVDPGGLVEWWFVPVQTVEANDLKCTIEGHAEAGMTGTIVVY
ncbi:MAG: biphenyl 2,3-dioxygenase [Gammaproteobacteria bacterium]